MKINMNLLQDATRTALTNMAGASGQESDPDLMRYTKLRPGDFPKLINRYGVESTLAYIKEMETKLQKGRK